MGLFKVLSNVVRQPTSSAQSYPPSMTQQQQQQQCQQPIYDEDMGYRTMTREDVANIQERRISTSLISPQTQASPMTPQNNVPIAPALPPTITAVVPSPVSPPSASVGHQRTASAPPAPPPPPMGAPALAFTGSPMGMSGSAGGPPPPPPPLPINMSRSQSSDGGEVNSLAAQLQNARLKRNNKVRNFHVWIS